MADPYHDDQMGVTVAVKVSVEEGGPVHKGTFNSLEDVRIFVQTKFNQIGTLHYRDADNDVVIVDDDAGLREAGHANPSLRIFLRAKLAPSDPAPGSSYLDKGLPNYSIGSLSGGSGSSVPSNHAPVTLEEKPFPLCVPFPMKSIPHLWHREEQQQKFDQPYVQLNSEADTVAYVRTALEDAIHFANLHLQLSAENTMASLRTDLLVLRLNGLPVGVIEVKKHDEKDLTKPNSNRIFGELFDYMMFLKSTFNLERVYGVLTRYSDWYVCWLDSSPSSSSLSSLPHSPERRYTGNVEPSTPTTPQASTSHTSTSQNESPSGRSVVQKRGHDVFQNSKTKTKTEVFAQPISRKMLRSRKFTFNDPELWRMLVTVLRKMDDTQPVASVGYSYAAEVGSQIAGFQWHFLNRCMTTEEMDFASFPVGQQKSYYVWENLGCGASGRAFLATSKTAPYRVGVVKCFFSGGKGSTEEKNDFRQEACDREYACWELIYPDYKRRKVTVFNNRPALLMQYFSPISVTNRHALLPNVKNTLLTFFDKKRRVHEDVKWRNIGQDVNGDIVVFDLGRVRKKTEDDKEWVDQAIEELEKRCGGAGASKVLYFSPPSSSSSSSSSSMQT